MITPKKQIVIQDVIEQCVAQIPQITVNTNITKSVEFGFGNDQEIYKFLKETGSNLYPLVWLLPSSSNYNMFTDEDQRDIKIIIATLETRKELFNKQRYKGSFSQVLFPIRDYLTHILNNSEATTIISKNVKTYEFPNYTETENDGIIDNWDAIRIDCIVKFKNYKVKTFNYQ